LVVVMGMVVIMVMMTAGRTTFAFVIMIMIVAMVVPMIVRRVRVLVGQKFRVDVENGVQVEAADVQQDSQVGFAEIDRRDRGARIDVHQAGAQRLIVCLVDQVFLGN